MSERRFTDAELEAAIEALAEPQRFRAAESRVSAVAPQLQQVLANALEAGGWFGEAHEAQIADAAGKDDPQQRLTALRTLLAEETRIGMLVGVAVGWELARELELTAEADGAI